VYVEIGDGVQLGAVMYFQHGLFPIFWA
jgi:hypothetical protein